jgi:hypothetical protein
MTRVVIQNIDIHAAEARDEVLPKYSVTVHMKVEHTEAWAQILLLVDAFSLEEGICNALAKLKKYGEDNVGTDKDSDRRQREAIQSFAGYAGLNIVGEYYDQAVSGAKIEGRPGFKALLDRIVGNGVKTEV